MLFEHLPAYVPRPVELPPLFRGEFGLENGQHVYVCSQNLRKFHPDFDAVLAELLRADPAGWLLVFGDTHADVTSTLVARFRRTLPDVLARVHMLPRMPREKYLALMAVSDVALDTFHFGAGITAYDTASVGTPLVTMPGEFARGRWAAAINRRLGVPELIAATPQGYVSKAVEVASNLDLRRTLRQRILQQGAVLFEDQAVIAEHDAYFSASIAALRERQS